MNIEGVRPSYALIHEHSREAREAQVSTEHALFYVELLNIFDSAASQYIDWKMSEAKIPQHTLPWIDHEKKRISRALEEYYFARHSKHGQEIFRQHYGAETETFHGLIIRLTPHINEKREAFIEKLGSYTALERLRIAYEVGKKLTGIAFHDPRSHARLFGN
ncbi:MAG: hypothetical protein M1450_00140 [Patescibacteria group bacterium]|nr:hypothetical protein [Patescibacteria group bacterium]